MKDRRLQSPFVEWEHHLVLKTSINTDDEKTKVQGGVCPKKASLHMLFSFCLYLNTQKLEMITLVFWNLPFSLQRTQTFRAAQTLKKTHKERVTMKNLCVVGKDSWEFGATYLKTHMVKQQSCNVYAFQWPEEERGFHSFFSKLHFQEKWPSFLYFFK